MSCEQFEQLMIELAQPALMFEQPIDCNNSDHAFLDLQRYAGANLSMVAGALGKEGLAGLADNSFEPLAETDPAALEPGGNLPFVACKHEFVALFVDHKQPEFLRSDHVHQYLVYAHDHLGWIQCRMKPVAGNIKIRQA